MTVEGTHWYNEEYIFIAAGGTGIHRPLGKRKPDADVGSEYRAKVMLYTILIQCRYFYFSVLCQVCRLKL